MPNTGELSPQDRITPFHLRIQDEGPSFKTAELMFWPENKDGLKDEQKMFHSRSQLTAHDGRRVHTMTTKSSIQ